MSRSLNRTGPIRALRAIAPVLAGVVILIGIALIVSRAWPRYEQPLWAAVPVQLAGLPAVLCGVALWLQQRGNYTGPVLLIFGLVWYLGNLQAIDQEFLFATGFSLYFLNIAVFTHLALLVPHGRLTTTAERATLALPYVILPGTQLLRYLEVRPLVNRQSFGDVGDYYSTWARIATYVGVPLAIVSVALVIRNFRRSTMIQRRAYAPFWLGASATGIAAVAAVLAELFPSDLPQRVALVVYALAVAGAAIGLLFGSVRLQAYSGGAFSGVGRPRRSGAVGRGRPRRSRASAVLAFERDMARLVRLVPASAADSRGIRPHDHLGAGFRLGAASPRPGAGLPAHPASRDRGSYGQRAGATPVRTLAFVDGQDAERQRIRQDLHLGFRDR